MNKPAVVMVALATTWGAAQGGITAEEHLKLVQGDVASALGQLAACDARYHGDGSQAQRLLRAWVAFQARNGVTEDLGTAFWEQVKASAELMRGADGPGEAQCRDSHAFANSLAWSLDPGGVR